MGSYRKRTSPSTAIGGPLRKAEALGKTVGMQGIIFGAGAPASALGANGNLYVRSDGGSMTTIYQKRAGSWTGIV